MHDSSAYKNLKIKGFSNKCEKDKSLFLKEISDGNQSVVWKKIIGSIYHGFYLDNFQMDQHLNIKKIH